MGNNTSSGARSTTCRWNARRWRPHFAAPGTRTARRRRRASCELLGLAPFTPHDLWRAAATMCGELGLSEAGISLCLDHQPNKDENGKPLPAVTGKVYNLATRARVAKKREVLDAWAVELRRIIGEPAAPNCVLPLDRPGARSCSRRNGIARRFIVGRRASPPTAAPTLDKVAAPTIAIDASPPRDAQRLTMHREGSHATPSASASAATLSHTFEKTTAFVRRGTGSSRIARLRALGLHLTQRGVAGDAWVMFLRDLVLQTRCFTWYTLRKHRYAGDESSGRKCDDRCLHSVLPLWNRKLAQRTEIRAVPRKGHITLR
jgi:hypothetical protein